MYILWSRNRAGVTRLEGSLEDPLDLLCAAAAAARHEPGTDVWVEIGPRGPVYDYRPDTTDFVNRATRKRVNVP